ncbi:MAG: 4-carboxymuconolactone decarboxylase [Hyphomicrobiales bacterium]|jgi:4-carboxymuconolactone decarboxylase|nr:4-carboxymuconolactone decarboxylase [Hyphomicrobiales bacterium]
MRVIFAIAFTLITGINMSRAEDRFPIIPPDQMNAEQKKLFETIISGPRAQNYGGDAANHVLKRGPFNAWMRSPEFGLKIQAVGEQIRFKSSIPKHLNEFAILITAREWTSQYEWYAHHALAMKAGLDPKIAEELAAGKRPSNMKEDEAAVYDFCTQLHRSKKVDHATFKRAKALFGEQGVIDLIGVSGYYTAVSMTLNVAEVPVPDGTLPLKPLD